MKPKATRTQDTGSIALIGSAEWNRRNEAWHRKFKLWSKAKKRAWLIEIGALTPEGNLPVYPMDHVPLGPRN